MASAAAGHRYRQNREANPRDEAISANSEVGHTGTLRLLLKLLPWLSAVLITYSAWSQQTIFDVPSADVAAKHERFYQHQTVARAWNPDRRWIQTNAAGWGIGHSLELDATWFNLELNSPGSVGSVGFKWSPRLNAEHASVPLRFVAGDLVQARGPSPRFGNWAYAMISAELPTTHTHLTGGVHTGTSILFGTKTVGVLVGIEYHLTDRWMLQADSFSGRHDLAYLIPGVVYRATPHWMVSLGYQIPNRHSAGFGAMVFELTRFP